jgi:hypothetical protein
MSRGRAPRCQWPPWDMPSHRGGAWTCWLYVHCPQPRLGMSLAGPRHDWACPSLGLAVRHRRAGSARRGQAPAGAAAPEVSVAESSGDWSRLGSSRTITALDTGVLLPSAVWFSGTSTLASG